MFRLAIIMLTALCVAQCLATTYYVDDVAGDDARSGLRDAPWRSVAAVNQAPLQPGDTVLFRRGGVWRESLIPPTSGSPGKPIIFAAYGTGAHPVFTGGENFMRREAWREQRTKVWATPDGSIPEDIGHVLIDGEVMARRVQSAEALQARWQFYYDAKQKRLLLCCETHPAEQTVSLEIAQRAFCVKIHHRTDLVFRELAFTNAAVHGLSAYNTARIDIVRCQVQWIGGKLLAGQADVGYGNGIEFGGNTRDCRVAQSDFSQIYDSAISHQNWDVDLPIAQQNIEFSDNRITQCAVGIEVFAHSGVTEGCRYRRNVIRDCGRGWSGNGGLWASGFRIVSSAIDFQDLRIEDNLIENSLHCGFYLSGGEIHVRGNVILDNEHGLYITGQDGNRPFTGTVERNVLARNRACGVYLVDAVGHCSFLHNTFVNNGELQQWNHHNVMLDGASNTSWRNNIFYSRRSLAISINNATHTLDYNCYYRPTGAVIGWDNTRRQFTAERFAEYQQLSGQDAHSIVADPRFVNVELLNFRLQPDSPCLGNALPVSGNLGAE